MWNNKMSVVKIFSSVFGFLTATNVPRNLKFRKEMGYKIIYVRV